MMKDLQWVNPTDSDNTMVAGPVRTNSGRTYDIAIRVPSTFPSDCPDLLVTRPAPLLDRRRKPLEPISATMHTIGTVGDCIKICHYQPALWTPDNTIYLVAIKGRIWLEAYELYLSTGKPLDTYLRHMSGAGRSSAPLPPPDSDEGIFLRLLRKLTG